MTPAMPLSETQYRTLEAMVDRIIPADDTPGALAGGALDYIAGQFQRGLRGKVPAYQAGLDAIDREARAGDGKPFAALAPAQQDALLSRVEQNLVQTDWPVNAREFFRMLVDHTAEGFYSDPANGGNRNAVSWEMIGF